MRIVLAFIVSLVIASNAYAQCNSTLLTLQSWSIEPVDDDTNKLTYTVKSNAEKPIKMVDGLYGFKDALGGQIASAAIERDAHIAPGTTFTSSNYWGPYTFERLLVLDKADVESFTCIRGVLYEDGTKEFFD